MELIFGILGHVKSKHLDRAIKKSEGFCLHAVTEKYDSKMFKLYSSSRKPARGLIKSQDSCFTYIDGHIQSEYDSVNLDKLKGPYVAIQWQEKLCKLIVKITDSMLCNLYYREVEGGVIFSNWLPVVDILFGAAPSFSEEKILSFLDSSFSLPGLSYYNGIKQLTPGHILTCKPSCVRKAALENIKFEPKLTGAYENIISDAKEIISNSVCNHLEFNQNIGSLMSGGLDSTTISALASVYLATEDKTLNVFSSIPKDKFQTNLFKGRVIDEQPLIRELLSMYPNMKANFLLPEQIVHSLCGVAKILQSNSSSPCAAPVNYPWLYSIAQTIRDQKMDTVLMGGFGNITFSWNYAQKSSSIYKNKIKPRLARIKRTLFSGSQLSGCLWRVDYSDSIYADAMSSSSDHENIYRIAKKSSAYNEDVYNTIQILNNFMFLDPTRDDRVVEYFLKIPDAMYSNNGRTRSIARDMTEGLLPDCIRLNSSRGQQAPWWVAEFKESADIYLKRLHDYHDISFIRRNFDFKKAESILTKVKGTPINNGFFKKNYNSISLALSHLQMADWVLYF